MPLNYELQLKRISVKEVYRSQKKKRNCFWKIFSNLCLKSINLGKNILGNTSLLFETFPLKHALFLHKLT